ncbi:MAG: WecB/TagA/CpsF family glycosyltransferase [bacterium]|nr:WecB/TagA/CpsF family glycosyltransferase [bacterium]
MRYSICSVPVDAATKKEALERCRGFLRDGAQHYVVTINPEIAVEAENNIAFYDVLRRSDLALADGAGIALAARWLESVSLERITGVDFMQDLCALAQDEGAKVFFLGGRKGVAAKTAEAMQKRFPRLRIAGWSDEPAGDLAIRHVDVLFIAFGAPKQELWIAENLPKLPEIKIAMGVGGAFDMISENKKRAPHIMRKLALEWLWRLIREPSRIRRMFRALIVFPLLAIRYRRAAR